MAEGQSGQAPRFSDDRQWWWTGTEWVPASQAPEQPPTPASPGLPAVAPIPVPNAITTRRTGWRWARWWTVALGLLLCFPVGLILTWMTSWQRPGKIVLSAPTVVVCGIFIVAVAAV